MTSNLRPDVERQFRKPSQNDIVEPEADDSGNDQEQGNADTQQTNVPRRPKSAAYVAPIPKIGSIPTFSPGIQFSPTERPKLPPFVGSFLMGKPVDEYGDIVDEKTGQVLARAGGDLPSLVGRKVSNRQGDILGEDGELLGYVADIEIERKGSAGSSMQSPHAAPPRSLFDIMGRSNASLMVDHVGNILDAGGNVVGKFHDNNNPLHRKEREERESQGQQQQQNEPSGSRTNKPESPFPPPPLPAPQELPEQQPEQQQGGEQEKSERRPRRTEEERRQTAADWRKEKPGESPSDIFLDVKSTTEGIQLTIRIPTVFGGGQQVRPNISFS